MNAAMLKYSDEVRQYYNTPSCHNLVNEPPFYER